MYAQLGSGDNPTQTPLHPYQDNGVLLPILSHYDHLWHDIATHGGPISLQYSRSLDITLYAMVIYMVPP